MRRQALDIFVNRIASHHELQKSEDLRTFLQAEEEVMFMNFLVICYILLYFLSVPRIIRNLIRDIRRAY